VIHQVKMKEAQERKREEEVRIEMKEEVMK
jgi:hypothetical protein